MNDDGSSQALQNTDELQSAFEELKYKNMELKGLLNYLQKEHSLYKEKYHSLKKRLFNLTDLLEKNVKVFNQLCDDAKCSLQLGSVSMLNSPLQQRKSVVDPKHNEKEPSSTALVKSSASRKLNTGHENRKDSDSPVAGPSGIAAPSFRDTGVTISRRQLHIEPLNMKELEQIESETTGESRMEISQEEIEPPPDKLSTVVEENSTGLDLCVKLERLPLELVKSYIHNQSCTPLSINSSLNVDDSTLSRINPNYSSTPLKTYHMNKLDLMPTPKKLDDFVSHRKTSRSQSSKNTTLCARSGLLSPKKERTSLVNNKNVSLTNNSSYRKLSSSSKENLLSPKTEKKSMTPQKDKSFVKGKKRRLDTFTVKTKSKRKKTSPDVSPVSGRNSRPPRKARPTNLKEEPLNLKKRRN